MKHPLTCIGMLLSAILISIVPARAQLNGTYTVGPNGNYTTITSAVSALNTSGVNGAVTFLLTGSTYSQSETFPIVINPVTGANSNYTVTFKPATGTSPTISGAVANGGLIKLNGADYIIIDGSNTNKGTTRDLTITNTAVNSGNGSTTSGNAVIWLANGTGSNGAIENVIKNCKLIGNSNTNTHMIIFSGSNTGIGNLGFEPGTPNSYNIIHNNFISKARFGVWLKGCNTSKGYPPDVNNQVTDNVFGTSATGDGFNDGALAVQLQDGALVSGNDIANVIGEGGTPDYTNNSANMVHFGIYVRNSKNVTVSHNRVHNIEYNGKSVIHTHGIHVDNNIYASSTSPSENTIHTNLVYDIRVNSSGPSKWASSGIALNGGHGEKIYYNTVYMGGNLSSSEGTIAAFSNGNEYNSVSNAGLTIMNNIFVVDGSISSGKLSPRFIAHFTTASTYNGSKIDHNDYYANSPSSGVTYAIGYFNTTMHTMLSTWRTATSQDANSFDLDPLFPSATNLRTLLDKLDNAATPISGITEDFAHKPRDAKTPDIGAYEFKSIPNDIKVEAVVSPVNGGCASSATVIGLAITNEGTKSQSNIPLMAILSGDIKANLSGTYTKTLTSTSTDTFYFSSTFNTTGGSNFDVEAFSELKVDDDRSNDTLRASISVHAPPAAPTAVNGSSCIPGKVQITAIAGKGQTLRWYATSTGGQVLHEGDTFTTSTLRGTETFYAEAVINNCGGPRTAVSSTINPKPTGASITKGANFQGSFNAGTFADKDVVCTGGAVQYELQPPTNFSNADFNSTWTIAKFTIATQKGSVPSSGIKVVPPGAANPGMLELVSSAAYEDSVLILNVTVQDIKTACDSSFSRYLYVAPQPEADFTNTTVCFGSIVNFTNQSNINKGSVSYQWSFGDGNTSMAKDPSHNYAAAGSYKAVLKIVSNSGCEDSIEKTVTVNPMPKVGFNFTEACQGNVTTFTNTSTIASGFFSDVSWNFGDGNTSKLVSPTHTYTTQGTYKVKLVLTSAMGCKDSLTQNVTVKAKPVANFISTDVCSGQKMVFSNRSSVFPAEALSYKWEFGDGNTSTDKDPEHQYAKAGTYNVKLTAESAGSCTEVINKQVTVYQLPNVKIGASASCQGLPVSFTDSSTVQGGTIQSRIWDFGDGKTSTSANPQHIYTASGSYTIKLTVTSNNGCQANSSRQITVNAKPTAAFTATDACMGTAVTFTNTSDASTYAWNFGDGNTSTAQNPTHTYTSAGTYKTTLVARSAGGCLDSISNTVTVHALPSAGWSLTKGTGREITFTAKEANHTAYLWNFGDGNTSTDKNPKHTYLKDSTYKVSLQVTNSNNCRQSHDSTFTLQTVGINSAPQMPSMKVEIAPNPFTAQTQIAYNLEKAARVKISVYDMSGKEVTVIADQKQSQGKYTFVLDAETHKMNAGIYLLRILVDDALITKQMIRMK